MITFVALVIVAASMALVGWPLFRGSRRSGPKLVEDTEVSELLAQKDSTLLAISELELDYAIGSLSRPDYESLRQKYEEKAVGLIRTADQLQNERGLGVSASLEDEIEERVSSLRKARKAKAVAAPKTCPGCQAQVEEGDAFCSKCGAATSLTCPGCSAAVAAEDSFCAKCGSPLKGAAA